VAGAVTGGIDGVLLIEKLVPLPQQLSIASLSLSAADLGGRHRSSCRMTCSRESRKTARKRD